MLNFILTCDDDDWATFWRAILNFSADTATCCEIAWKNMDLIQIIFNIFLQTVGSTKAWKAEVAPKEDA